ncbi:MAG: type II toxin-antitoxin system RelB/DinJ family antitoxin [Candidatus Peribacteraceae bacterium]|nr:type II toxin-antitoxin system RelB/DinJ family antitoxin [Candidatus Peribacteraceae bacterium]
MTTTIQVRMNPKLKKEVQKILETIGLDMSGAINIYFRHISLVQGIPFPLRTANGFTLEQERELLREEAWAIKHGKRYSSAKEMHEDILKE